MYIIGESYFLSPPRPNKVVSPGYRVTPLPPSLPIQAAAATILIQYYAAGHYPALFLSLPQHITLLRVGVERSKVTVAFRWEGQEIPMAALLREKGLIPSELEGVR